MLKILVQSMSSLLTANTALETGLSDCHKLVVTVLKTYIKKKDPAKISHRSYKNVDLSTFRNELKQNLEQFNQYILTYDDFKHIFMKILDLHAPINESVVRANNQPFVTKQLRKAIMTRSRLKNKYNKNANEENGRLHKKATKFLCIYFAKGKDKVL